MIQTKVSNLILNIPEDISEISLGQFLDLRASERNKGGMLENLSILTKVDVSAIYQAADNSPKQTEGALNLCNLVYASISEFDNSISKFQPPKSVTILAETYKVPQDLKRAPFGAIILVKSLMRKQGPGFDPTEDIDQLLAHFLYETVTGLKYNEYRADDLRETMRDISFLEAIKLFNFFFLRSSRLFLPTSSHFLTLLHLKRRKLASRLSEFMKTLTRSTD